MTTQFIITCHCGTSVPAGEVCVCVPDDEREMRLQSLERLDAMTVGRGYACIEIPHHCLLKGTS